MPILRALSARMSAGAREDYDADGHAVENLVVALEGCGLGVFGPVRLEGDLRHFAVGGRDRRDALSTLSDRNSSRID